MAQKDKIKEELIEEIKLLQKQIVELEKLDGERKKAEEALEALEKMSTNIIESAQDAIMMMDNDGNISSWNKAAEVLFGYSEKEVLGKELHALLSPKRYHDAHRRAFPHFQKTGEGAAVGKTLELAAARKDGTEFSMELSMSAFRLKGMWCAAGIVRDVTERKQAEEEREKTLLWQQDINRIQQSLLAPAMFEEKLKTITDSIVRIFDADCL